MPATDIKFWVHRDGLTGRFYTTTNFALTTSDHVNDAHVYRTLKGARNQIKGRVDMFRDAVDLMEGFKKNSTRDAYFRENWPRIEAEGRDAIEHLKDPNNQAYIEIVEVTSIVTLTKVNYK